MNIFVKFFNWLSGRDKYLAQIDKQMELIESLQAKKEIVTFLQPVRPEESESYAKFISNTWNNRYFKWFLNDIERAVMSKFKTGENADFCRGQLAMVDIFAMKMTEVSNSYIINMKTGAENE